MRGKAPKLAARLPVLTKINYMNTYGVINREGAHTDVSLSERGAKNYATRNGYNKVSVRFNYGYDVVIIAKKNSAGKWVQVN